MMKIIVNKFGGSVFGDYMFVRASVNQVRNQIAGGYFPIVVVSALKGVTDQLVNLSNRYSEQGIKEIQQKHYDFIEQFSLQETPLKVKIDELIGELEFDLKKENGICKGARMDAALSYGEAMSALVFAELLLRFGIPNRVIQGEKLGILTDELWGDANIYYEESAVNIRKEIQKLKIKNRNKKSNKSGFGGIPVIAGFIGKTRDGQITTLGRGGSDTTACLVGSALKAEKVILWKDVPGVLSGDPHLAPNARTISAMDYEEAEESGKVIHDKSMYYIKKEKITVEVADVMDARRKTVVTEHGSKRQGVKVISYKDRLLLLIITGDKIKRAGALAEISHCIASYGINMVFIRNTRDNLYIVVEKNGHPADAVVERICQLGYSVQSRDVSMVTIIGHLSSRAVERFNRLLHRYVRNTEFGAFPYRNCVRLEAIVHPSEVAKMVKVFHREFIK